MGLFKKKNPVIESSKVNVYDELFPNVSDHEILLTKRMVFDCVDYSDKLLQPPVFRSSHIKQQSATIAFAKMGYYKLITRSPIAHNLFYGFLHELYASHYKLDLETILLTIHNIHLKEREYITGFYDFFQDPEGSMAPVMDRFYRFSCNQTDRKGNKLLQVSEDDFCKAAGQLLEEMHFKYTSEFFF